MPNKFTLEALKLLLNARNGWRVVVLAVLGLIAYRLPSFVELVNAKKEAEEIEQESQEFLDSADIYVTTFRRSQQEQDARIEDALHGIEYLSDKLNNAFEIQNLKIEDVDHRDQEKGAILLEELDPIDSLGANLYQTNPGNLYFNKDGHFISVIKDHQKRRFFYMNGNKRIYLP